MSVTLSMARSGSHQRLGEEDYGDKAEDDGRDLQPERDRPVVDRPRRTVGRRLDGDLVLLREGHALRRLLGGQTLVDPVGVQGTPRVDDRAEPPPGHSGGGELEYEVLDVVAAQGR